MIVDTNVYLSRWPFRRLPGDDAAHLAVRLRKHGVTEAWAGTFDGLLHKDIAGANARLAAACRAHGNGLLKPFGSINPQLPGWQEDLRRCVEEHQMAGIRLHPNYHGYHLQDPRFVELLTRAAARGLIVQLVASMEDVRTQHPLLRVPPVDLAPLPRAIERAPGVRLVLLNWGPASRPEALPPLAAAGAVCFDIATLEGIEGVARMAERVPADRIVFGSHAPLFYFESALLKIRESGLPESQKARILEGNARRLGRERAA